MNIVLLGHQGFIGQHVIKYLNDMFVGIDVIGLSSDDLNLADPIEVKELSSYLNKGSVLVVCAAIKKQLGDSLSIFRKNMEIVENLCSVLEQHSIRQLVYLSSAAVYGEDIHNISINENTPTNPRSFYGISKLTAESLLTKVFRENTTSSLAIVRPPLVYGVGDMSKGYGPAAFIDKILSGQNYVALWGDGSELREFLYIDDLAKLVYLIISQNYDGVLNAVSGKSYSFQDVLNSISKDTGADFSISQNTRSKDKVDNVFDAQKLYSCFPSFSFTSLEQGISKTLLSIKEQSS